MVRNFKGLEKYICIFLNVCLCEFLEVNCKFLVWLFIVWVYFRKMVVKGEEFMWGMSYLVL